MNIESRNNRGTQYIIAKMRKSISHIRLLNATKPIKTNPIKYSQPISESTQNSKQQHNSQIPENNTQIMKYEMREIKPIPFS